MSLGPPIPVEAKLINPTAEQLVTGVVEEAPIVENQVDPTEAQSPVTSQQIPPVSPIVQQTSTQPISVAKVLGGGPESPLSGPAELQEDPNKTASTERVYEFLQTQLQMEAA